jgi:hypothetical protein
MIKLNHALLLERLEPDVKLLTERITEASRLVQDVVYGKEFVAGRDVADLRVAIGHALGDFLEMTLHPDRDSMRHAPGGRGGRTR